MPRRWTPEHLHPYFSDTSALALARLRRDGFVSLDADKQGTAVTRALVLSGERLHVNVDASAGRLRAELLDADTLHPLDGFTLEDCRPVTGDQLGTAVTWSAPIPQGRPVRIHFELNKASLYSFWAA